MQEYKVKTISNGIAYGKVLNVFNDFIIPDSLCSNTVLEKRLFKEALNSVINDLERMRSSDFYKDEDFILVHIMILKDNTMIQSVCDLIENKRYCAMKAFNCFINEYIEKLFKAQSIYLIERNLDFKDIRNRVLSKLSQKYFKTTINDKIILSCDELYPSLLMEYKHNIAGVIAKSGGNTSHGAILCKAREIPYVLLTDRSIKDNTNVIIDTRKQAIYVDCDKDTIYKYRALKKQIKKEKPIDDFSNYKIKILANVSSNDDLDKVIKYNMDGVGLYRTEFIFMNLNRPLSYEEQKNIYLDAVLKLKGKSITFRTFDIGDDKQLSYLKVHKKGILNYKNNRQLFVDQVRAILNANRYSNIKIMFPMIETYDEFNYLRDYVLKIKREERNDSYVKIGMMLETKSALEHLDDFKDIDFMSLGTNDLTSELYNLKRSEVLNYNLFIDDLISKLQLVVNHCKKYNIELSICGEIASVKEVIEKLYSIGLKQYSISASNAKSCELALKNILNID